MDKVIDGEIRNLMVFMPPGSAKSTYASVRFPAYYLGRLGKKSIICGSYGGDLATSFGRKVRNLVDSKENKNVFPALSLTEDSRARGEWETRDGGTYFAVGVGGGVTGRRGDLGLIDDPVKGRKEADSDLVKLETWNWYNSDFMTRLKPNAAQVLIQTRWVDDDLSGRLLTEDWDGESGIFEGTDGKEWHVICLQAQAEKGKNDPLGRKPGEWLWIDYFTEEFWKETKTAQAKADIRNWQALYQQRPAPDEGTYFKRDWFNRYPLGDHPKHITRFGASDYAVSDDGGDYTEQGVAGLDSEGELYMLDWISGQTESDVWVDDLLDLTAKHDPVIWGAEVGQIKKAVAPWLKKRSRKRKIFIDPEPMAHVGDKAANARSFQAMAKLGMVYIPSCEWGDELIRQLCKFPAGAFDDKVDVCGLMGRLIDKVWDANPPEEEKEKPVHDYKFNEDEDESWKAI
ncbi:MAG: phage terminase large subunit [Chloroflexota bacterium]